MTVYLDYNASTPVAPCVVDAMTPWFGVSFANPGSQHAMGQAARAAVRDARERLADLVGVGPAELIFTSGATEANNVALRGIDPAVARERPRIITFETEHPSVLEPLRSAADQGTEVDILPVEPTGLIDLGRLEASLGPDVGMVSAMLINNETGVTQPIERIADLAHSFGALLHSDVTQAVGKLPLNLAGLGVDLATMSAHKVYGPKGSGALYVRRGVPLVALTQGGGQERGLRSGTENVPAIIGFAAAAQWAITDLGEEAARIEDLRNQMISGLTGHLDGVYPITLGDAASSHQSPWTISVRFRGADAEAVIANAPGLAVSAGSACSSGTPEPSHVLTAMLGDSDAASECVRISFGRPTIKPDIESAVQMLSDAVTHVRTLT